MTPSVEKFILYMKFDWLDVSPQPIKLWKVNQPILNPFTQIFEIVV